MKKVSMLMVIVALLLAFNSLFIQFQKKNNINSVIKNRIEQTDLVMKNTR
jgi:hypothetical protein